MAVWKDPLVNLRLDVHALDPRGPREAGDVDGDVFDRDALESEPGAERRYRSAAVDDDLAGALAAVERHPGDVEIEPAVGEVQGDDAFADIDVAQAHGLSREVQIGIG